MTAAVTILDVEKRDTGQLAAFLKTMKTGTGKQDEVTGEGQPVTAANTVFPVPIKFHLENGRSPATHSFKPLNTVKQKHVAKLIGGKCMLSCYLNGVRTQMLLDSGAQVSMVGKSWVENASK